MTQEYQVARALPLLGILLLFLIAASSTLIMQSGLNKHSFSSDTATVINMLANGYPSCSPVG